MPLLGYGLYKVDPAEGERCISDAIAAGYRLIDTAQYYGNEGYMGRLVRDAGGVVVGAQAGSASSVMSVEEAFRLSHETDIWLCPGYCQTRQQLAEIHHLFPHFGPLANGLPIFNNILRANSGGGNDFWESGAVRPDLILQDLRKIFSPSESSDRLELNYFISLQ